MRAKAWAWSCQLPKLLPVGSTPIMDRPSLDRAQVSMTTRVQDSPINHNRHRSYSPQAERFPSQLVDEGSRRSPWENGNMLPSRRDWNTLDLAIGSSVAVLRWGECDDLGDQWIVRAPRTESAHRRELSYRASQTL